MASKSTTQNCQQNESLNEHHNSKDERQESFENMSKNSNRLSNGQGQSKLNSHIEMPLAVPSLGGCYEPIAIIGYGMRLPGGINNGEALWELLVNKKDGRCRVPADRYNIDAFIGPGKQGCVASEYGYFLEHVDLTAMDTSFWSITGKEIGEIDPQQRLALEVVYECLQNSGTTKWHGRNIGTYFGTFGEDWADMQTKENQPIGSYRIPGSGDFAVANRVSYEFGFRGPSVVIRTACSSSLTGLHEACRALHGGECESAIVGGTNLILNPHMTITMSEQNVLSPDARCKTFDAAADGYARAEAVVAVHIKKLSDAIRDNDPIRAVIRSTCINSDGKTAGLSRPSSESHEALIRRSHALAGIENFAQTAVIECHGTGTQVGDPIEATAVGNVFGEHGIYISSIKPNLGHTEGAAGILSLIKMTLALERNIIPPNINFKTPNPKIAFKKNKLEVPTEALPWPEDRAERVGINSYGIGGANAHALLESARSIGISSGPIVAPSSKKLSHLLLNFSANTQDSLKELIRNHETYLYNHPDRIWDLSYTLNLRREPLLYRTFSVVSTQRESESLDISPIVKANSTHELVWVFTGQGAQWASMGADLLKTNNTFYEAIERLECELEKLPDGPHWSLQEELLRPADESRLSIADFSQPCCTAVQIALVDVLEQWGLRPHAVVGHSSGEIAAAYAAKAITASDAMKIAFYRGQVTQRSDGSSKGAMAAVGLGRDAVIPHLLPGVVVGCINSPESVTLSGDATKLKEVTANIAKEYPDIMVRQLRVDRAYHSHHMKAVKEAYLSALGNIETSAPRVDFYSTVSGQILETNVRLDSSYWVSNLVSPVLFSDAVLGILRHRTLPKAFLEIGPHSALAGPLRQIFRSEGLSSAKYIPTLIRGETAFPSLLNTAGSLFQLNFGIRLEEITPSGSTLTDLPTYPWHRQGNHWAESRLSRDWRLRQYAHHDILGSRVTATAGSAPTWRNLLRLEDVPWIRDHNIAKDIVFPGAGYISMAGEAVRQLTGSTSFTVREVNIINALVMYEGKTTEVLTHLKAVRLTTNLDSEWFEFEISSLNGENWVKHAFGQVRPGARYSMEAPQVHPLPRQVSSEKWYSVMKRFSVSYGPRFVGMRDIRTDVSGHRALALIDNDRGQGESQYSLHPCTIDFAIQLYSVAGYQGLSRLFTTLLLPTYIEELYIQPAAAADILVQIDANFTRKGTLYGDAVGMVDGEIVFRFKNLHMTPLPDQGDLKGPDPHAAAELVWKPDVHFVDPGCLIQSRKTSDCLYNRLEELSLACIIESRALLDGGMPGQYFPLEYKKWIDKTLTQAFEGNPERASNVHEFWKMTSAARIRLIEQICQDIQSTEIGPLALIMRRVLDAGANLCTGKDIGLDTLLSNDLERLYDCTRSSDLSTFIELASHYKPNLRILEIGAGNGGATKTILPLLKSEYGQRMYLSYTYTDVSGEGFATAKERFKEFDAVEYIPLDISIDPLGQGFQAHHFDLIISSNAMHEIHNREKALRHVRKLLTPDGYFILEEASPTANWINYARGTCPTWWSILSGSDSGGPLLPYSEWEQILQAAGFDLKKTNHDRGLSSCMISTAKKIRSYTKRVTLLVGSTPSKHLAEIRQDLQRRGVECDICVLGSSLPVGQDVVSLLDFEEPFFQNLDADRFNRIRDLLTSLNKDGILWVTGATQIECVNPNYAMILGIARNARTELGLDIAILELDRFDECSWDLLAKVIQEFQERDRNETDAELRPSLEWAFSNGVLHIGRFYWTSVNKQLDTLANSEPGKMLDIERRGFLNSLYWKNFTPAEPLGDCIQARNYAVGLNFKDVLISMGIIEGKVAIEDHLGCESAGIVERVGPGVKELAPGDRIMVCSSALFATHFTAKEQLCVKLPETLDYVEAASMASVFSTVIYSLLDMARIEEGQSVLIHSACGGIGLAALQICQMVGVKTYCTVGSKEKADFLIREFNIPARQIFNSRDLAFQRDVLRETSGHGVDVVLNSLSGELLHASWQCVAEFGCMVEIGKRDLLGKGSLGLDLFARNRSYIGVDFAQICAQRPHITASLLKRAVEYYNRGYIKPIHPITQFEAHKVEDAMRFIQKGTHIGKVVVTLPESPVELRTKSVRPKFKLDPNASYLLVGGLGGLGQAVSVWMAESGATELLFLSRSAGHSERYQAFVNELSALGCSATMISGTVANMRDVETAISAAKRPIRGVMQASMVLKDNALGSLTFEDWQAAVTPKVNGTWNLHHALERKYLSLDFFLLFSSMSGLLGQWGQANYASANAFLDAFTQYRHSRGLPAATLDIGVLEDIGFASTNARVIEHFQTTSMHLLYEQELLDSLQLMIGRSVPAGLKQPGDQQRANGTLRTKYVNSGQLAIGLRSTQPLSAPNNRIVWKRDQRMALYRNIEAQPADNLTTNDEKLQQYLALVALNPGLLDSDEAVIRIAEEIGRTLFSFMLRNEDLLDIEQPLASLGVDSLIAIELRNWLRHRLKVDITVLEILGSQNIKSLGRQTSKRLKEKHDTVDK